jgi:hypothetical protein
MWITKGQWLHMKITTVGWLPKSVSEEMARPVAVSGSMNDGAMKPRGFEVVGVIAMEAFLLLI